MAAFSKEQLGFVSVFTGKYQELGGTEPLVLAEDRFELTSAGISVNLVNLFHEFQSLPEEHRAEFLANIARPLIGKATLKPLDADRIKSSLRLAVRERMTFSAIELENRARGETNYSHPAELIRSFTENLVSVLVLDEGTSIRFVQTEEMVRSGLSCDEAFELAEENLRTTVLDQFRAHQVAPGVLLCACDDPYAVSRLLFPRLAEALEKRMQGELVVLPINPSTLLFTGAEEVAGHRAFLETAQELLDDPRPMSPVPLVWNGSRWTRWEPQPRIREYPAFQKMIQHALGRDYKEQEELLKRVYKTEARDIYVASFHGLQAEDTIKSFCIWPRERPAILPKTDFVAFLDPELAEAQGIRLGNWAAVQSQLGDRLVPQKLYPECFLAEECPAIEIVRKIAAPRSGSSAKSRLERMIRELFDEVR